MQIEIFPEREGEYINFNAFNDEDGILGVMRVHESATELEIINITIFPEYSYHEVVRELFDYLLTKCEESECYKTVNIIYDLNDETDILHAYLYDREDFFIMSNGSVYNSTVKEAADIIDDPEMKKILPEIKKNVKLFKELSAWQKKDLTQKLLDFSLIEKEDAKNMEEWDEELSCVTCDNETGEIFTALLSHYDEENETLCIDAAFLTHERKKQFIELVIYFMNAAIKKYPDAKFEVAAVNDRSEALCDHFVKNIKNVTITSSYTGIWTGIQDDKLKDAYIL